MGRKNLTRRPQSRQRARLRTSALIVSSLTITRSSPVTPSNLQSDKLAPEKSARATLQREHLILTQTPQVFAVSLLREAFARAEADEFVGTDESSLVERLEKVEVSVVAGSHRNIKITKPTDLALAKLYLQEETLGAAR